MKASQLKQYGTNAAVVCNEQAPRPAVSAGRILVEIHAAGVNPIDYKVRGGYLSNVRPLKFPAVLGRDFSGRVAELGAGVSGFAVGDAVFGVADFFSGEGSFAELATISPTALAPAPRNIGLLEAAALPLAGVSALQGLVDHIGLQKGQKILIHGGAGGIGSLAIQLAHSLGAYVVATVSGRDLQFARDLGADEALDYQGLPFEKLVSDFDAVFDTIGGETYERSFGCLARGGIVVSLLEKPRPELIESFHVRALAQMTEITADRLTRLAELVERGAIKVLIDKTFPLAKVGEALDYLKTGHPRGKVVVKIR